MHFFSSETLLNYYYYWYAHIYYVVPIEPSLKEVATIWSWRKIIEKVKKRILL